MQDMEIRHEQQLAESSLKLYLNEKLKKKVHWESFCELDKKVRQLKNFVETNVVTMCDAYNTQLKRGISDKVDTRYLEKVLEPRIDDELEALKNTIVEMEGKITALEAANAPEDDQTQVEDRPSTQTLKLDPNIFAGLSMSRPGTSQAAFMEKNMEKVTARLGEYSELRKQLSGIEIKLAEVGAS